MSPPANNETGMETRVALIEKEFHIVHGIFQKFESALEKMTDISNSVQKLLAVHDQRITEREKAEASILESIERRRDEFSRNADKISEKMEEMGTELRKQVKDELSELSDTVKSSMKEMTNSQEKMVEKFEKRIENADAKYKDMEGRIRALENWRWLFVGGGAVVGFIVAKWSFFASLLSSVGAGT